jgi:hypothetical protein
VGLDKAVKLGGLDRSTEAIAVYDDLLPRLARQAI